MRLSKDLEGLISNYQRIIDGYLAGAPADKLAKSVQILAGNFDGPILDLDAGPAALRGNQEALRASGGAHA
jgi:hypothetical protein